MQEPGQHHTHSMAVNMENGRIAAQASAMAAQRALRLARTPPTPARPPVPVVHAHVSLRPRVIDTTTSHGGREFPDLHPQAENVLLLLRTYGEMSYGAMFRKHEAHFGIEIRSPALFFGGAELIKHDLMGWTGKVEPDEVTNVPAMIWDVFENISDEQRAINAVKFASKKTY